MESGSKEHLERHRNVTGPTIAFTLIETAKLNDIDPQAWLTW
ncbi:transposase domain-containing protein [uncultured Tateyamaria sp.]